MKPEISRRTFASAAGGLLLAAAGATRMQEEGQKQEKSTTDPMPREADFNRDYPAPSFKPSWKNPQLNRQLVQDFVIYAHSELDMVKKLIEREPGLLNATMDWGAGDWESGLNGAAHMGRHDIVEFLLERGSRIDIFCAAMMGQLDAVRSFLTLQPALIDAKGPHGFSLHFHAQVGTERSANVLELLQSIKHVELKPIPFLTDKPK